MFDSGRSSGRHSHEYGGSLTRSGLDLHCGADQCCAFVHAEQTEAAPIGVHLARSESHAVVFDDQRHLIRPALENDFDVAGAGVLGDVVERFLGNSVQRGFDLGGESLGR